MTQSTGTAVLEHLTPDDRDLIRRATGDPPEPDNIFRLLAHPGTHDAIFGGESPSEQIPFLDASPFLVFGAAVHRAADELDDAVFTHEWVGPKTRVPVFDVDVLREFLAPELRRLFLIELLASYTHVVSGSTWVMTPRGMRRHRFSELDPVRLASLLEVVPEVERPGVYRRLGDLSLFLTGVFPDHTAARGVSLVDEDRLRRMVGIHEPDAEHDAGPSGLPPERLGAVGLLEELGRRWYHMAAEAARGPLLGSMQVAREISGHFREARRVLNYMTDRFLFPFRSHMFGSDDT